MDNLQNIPNLVGAQRIPAPTLQMPKMPVPEVPVAPALPVEIVGGQMVETGVINLFGQEFQKKHVYILGLVVVLVVGYLVYRWYSKSGSDDEDEEDEMDDMGYQQYMHPGMHMGMPGGMPGGMPPGMYQGMQGQGMAGQGMAPPPGWRPEMEMPQQMSGQPQGNSGMNDQQFDEEMEQAIQDV